MLKDYYLLTKPGIVYGNDLAAIAGFLFGAGRHLKLGEFIAMLVGTSLVIASACVFNNYLDRGIDAKMKRTQKRALPRGSVSSLAALSFGATLGAFGLALLAAFTNWLTFGVAAAGMILYVIVYGIAKRKTVYSTLVGSLSGSTPPVIGYVAATGRLDLAALLLFLVMAAWQMPHFYAIAMFRRDDYAAANLPIWSVQKGMASTKNQIILYVFLFILACLALSIFSGGGWIFALAMLVCSAQWLRLGFDRKLAKDDIKWSRKMFGFSLMTLLILSVALAVNPWLP